MRDQDYKLNMNTIPFEVFCALKEMDEKYVGTKDYMGIAYFWGLNGIKHYLRDATFAQRKRVHSIWLKRGLDFWGETEEHYAIVKQAMRLEVQS